MRIGIRRNDKNDQPKAMDVIYSALDKEILPYIGVGKATHTRAVDTKFIVAEIANNFLMHDDQFFVANVELEIDSITLLVTLGVSHDGIEFNPIDPGSKCKFIRAAAERLTVSMPGTSIGESVRKKLTLKFSLKA